MRRRGIAVFFADPFRSSRLRRSARGFTIMEALMVIVLMTVLIAVFASVFTSARLLRKAEYSIQASNFVREELDTLRTLPFAELLSRTNGSFLGVALTRGPWKVAADGSAPSSPNVLTLTTTQPDLYYETGQAILPGNYRKDFDVTAKIKVLSSSPNGWRAGIAFRYRDAENNYRFRFSSGGIALTKIYHGSVTTLWSQSATYNTNTWYTLEVIANGSNFTLKKNGSTLTTVTDTSFTSGNVTLITLSNALVQADDVTMVEGGSTTSWNFDGDPVGSLPASWQRLAYTDLPSGAATLTISNYLGQSNIKQCVATVTWSDMGTTRTMSGSTLIAQQQ